MEMHQSLELHEACPACGQSPVGRCGYCEEHCRCGDEAAMRAMVDRDRVAITRILMSVGGRDPSDTVPPATATLYRYYEYGEYRRLALDTGDPPAFWVRGRTGEWRMSPIRDGYLDRIVGQVTRACEPVSR
ncbi:MAG TPA: hypothetical protein VFH61_18070 [Thermoleophilia bacterium]|nr:hypothetical protein [Thermoleophilia bacterium]